MSKPKDFLVGTGKTDEDKRQEEERLDELKRVIAESKENRKPKQFLDGNPCIGDFPSMDWYRNKCESLETELAVARGKNERLKITLKDFIKQALSDFKGIEGEMLKTKFAEWSSVANTQRWGEEILERLRGKKKKTDE